MLVVAHLALLAAVESSELHVDEVTTISWLMHPVGLSHVTGLVVKPTFTDVEDAMFSLGTVMIDPEVRERDGVVVLGLVGLSSSFLPFFFL